MNLVTRSADISLHTVKCGDRCSSGRRRDAGGGRSWDAESRFGEQLLDGSAT